MSTLNAVRARLTDVLDAAFSDPCDVAGAVVGVAIGDQDVTLARGSANLATQQPFTADTGWLLGSVTKVLTTTMLLRQVERGAVHLDAPATRYVPEFQLRDAGTTGQITVRMLLNHTNGIDADALLPSAVRGRDASRSYIERLREVGVLFRPGAGLHYSNPGFVLAARIIEECTGLPFERAIQQEVFDVCGMLDATALQTQALLRRTAVGAFADPDTGALRATSLFTLSESLAGAGTTPIVTVADMFAFGRMHLRDGVAPNGERVLTADSVHAMQTPTFDLGIPQAPPVGLGWWLVPIADTIAAGHGGGSPGGVSSFAILRHYDAVVVGFAAGPGARRLHDMLHNTVVEELTGRAVTPPFEIAPRPPDPDVVGEYGSFQFRIVVEKDGDALLVTNHFEPCDEDHRLMMDGFGTPAGPAPTITYTSVAPGKYVPVGTDLASLGGMFGRMALLATMKAGHGRRAGLHTGLRYTPKLDGAAERP